MVKIVTSSAGKSKTAGGKGGQIFKLELMRMRWFRIEKDAMYKGPGKYQ